MYLCARLPTFPFLYLCASTKFGCCGIMDRELAMVYLNSHSDSSVFSLTVIRDMTHGIYCSLAVVFVLLPLLWMLLQKYDCAEQFYSLPNLNFH